MLWSSLFTFPLSLSLLYLQLRPSFSSHLSVIDIMAQSTSNKTDFVQADKDGHFRRPPSQFRDTIPSATHPAEADRYVLFLNYGCPWAQRTNIVRVLKGLEDIVELVEVDHMDPGPTKGWCFSGKYGPPQNPYTGGKYLRELYEKDDPSFTGRPTVPTLWDKTLKKIVNNDSGEIMRMFYTAFDELLPSELRESTKGAAGLLPSTLRTDIEAMNTWMYDTVNNGVYKAGFATTQEIYETHVYPVFESLDRLEKILAESKGPYLFGEHITEADIRLFTTAIRFDTSYYMLFKINLKMIRHDYPHLHRWLRVLYWDETERTRAAFKTTTKFDRVCFTVHDPRI